MEKGPTGYTEMVKVCGWQLLLHFQFSSQDLPIHIWSQIHSWTSTIGPAYRNLPTPIPLIPFSLIIEIGIPIHPAPHIRYLPVICVLPMFAKSHWSNLLHTSCSSFFPPHCLSLGPIIFCLNVAIISWLAFLSYAIHTYTPCNLSCLKFSWGPHHYLKSRF